MRLFRAQALRVRDWVGSSDAIADKAFDSNALVAELNERGARVVISQHPARAQTLKIDAAIYTWRHLIENFFCKLKEFKCIAMRACKPIAASRL